MKRFDGSGLCIIVCKQNLLYKGILAFGLGVPLGVCHISILTCPGRVLVDFCSWQCALDAYSSLLLWYTVVIFIALLSVATLGLCDVCWIICISLYQVLV